MQLPKKTRNRIIVISLVIAVSLILLFFALREFGGDGKTQVILANIGDCSEVTLVLSAQDRTENLTLKARRGATERVNVRANIAYDYQILTPTDDDENDKRCQHEGQNQLTEDQTQIILDFGTVQVPAGSKFSFNVDSVSVETDE